MTTKILAAACAAFFLAITPHDGSAQAQVSAAVSEYVDVDEPAVVLRGVRIIDGTGAEPQANRSIIIRDGRITDIGPAGEIAIPADARVLDLSGHSVIPGIIGVHNHTFYTTSLRSVQLNYSAPRLYLGSGVTTIRTTGSMSPYAEINLKDAIDSGESPGPRMFVTGPYITGGRGVSSMNRVTGADEARRVVSYWADEGVSWLKAYTEISRAALGAMIEEAHANDVKVTAHLCSVTFGEAVSLGIDHLEHGLYASSDFHPNKTPDECPADHFEQLAQMDIESAEVDATLQTMVNSGVGLTSTQAVYELDVPNRPPLEQRVLDALSPEARAEYLATRERIADAANQRQFRISADLFKKAQRFEYKFVEAGGLLAAGVDPTGIGGALAGYGDQRNYELLIETGFDPVESIKIMTLNGARTLGIDEDLGSLEIGKIADIVVIDGDPINNPADIRKVALVFKDGRGYDAQDLLESVNGTVGIR